MDDAAQDRIFAALSHPDRRRMLDLLFESPGLPVGALAENFAMSRIAVMKHLRVLDAAGLLISRKSGRSRLLFFNVVPLQQISDRWSDRYASFWSGRLADLKDRIESTSSASHLSAKKGRSSRAG